MEIKRILKPGGVFLQVAYTKEWLDKLPYTQYGFAKYTMEELRMSIKNAGLSLIGEINLREGKSYCMIIKK